MENENLDLCWRWFPKFRAHFQDDIFTFIPTLIYKRKIFCNNTDPVFVITWLNLQIDIFEWRICVDPASVKKGGGVA